jgi:branched-subunit amino acid transport protein
MIMNDYFIAILGMSIVTQIPRIIPSFTKTEIINNRLLKRFLDTIPLAALGALIAPGVFTVGGAIWIGLAGGILSLVLAFRKANLMLNIFLSTLFVTALIYFF